MNRTIKFRGLQKKTKDWVYGYYFYSQREDKHYISGDSIDYGFQSIEVDPATVGQYTGLKDKNKIEIYEGDILATSHMEESEAIDNWDQESFGNTQVVWTGSGFTGTEWPIGVDDGESVYDMRYVEVVGNIYEHPELLEGGTE